MTKIRVLLADDHSVLRAGLVALLHAESDVEVVGEAGDGFECIDKAMELRPDVILMDVNMPRCSGLEALARIHADLPETRVLMLTMHDDVGYLRHVLASGGAGYVLKSAASEDLLTALRTVHDGGVYIHPHHAHLLVADEPDGDGGPESAAASDLARRYESLSERESEVFRFVALGHSNREIAEMSFLSVRTVETYKARLMKKLGLESRAALVRAALELDLLH
ncbi:MAG: response regulator transcription factor [Actinomycetota bacterium]|nr:response regulator transcription factor [Actinomycetota bacterium]